MKCLKKKSPQKKQKNPRTILIEISAQTVNLKKMLTRRKKNTQIKIFHHSNAVRSLSHLNQNITPYLSPIQFQI